MELGWEWRGQHHHPSTTESFLLCLDFLSTFQKKAFSSFLSSCREFQGQKVYKVAEFLCLKYQVKDTKQKLSNTHFFQTISQAERHQDEPFGKQDMKKKSGLMGIHNTARKVTALNEADWKWNCPGWTDGTPCLWEGWVSN